MIHLHVHTDYSFRDSTISIQKLIERTMEFEMGAVAITDHGNMRGALEFYMLCKEKGIKPIIGMEAYVVPDMSVKEKGDKRYHLTLLARNRTGYQNLLQIASTAAVDGFYYVPRADLDLLAKHRGGLCVLTGCLQSALYMAGDDEKAVLRMARKIARLFRHHFYLEIQPHELKEQKYHNLLLYNVSLELGLPLIATKDCHYLDDKNKRTHDILMAIQNRDPYQVDLAFCGPGELMLKFQEHARYLPAKEIAESVYITDAVADAIGDYELPIEQFEFPDFILGGTA